MTYSSAHSMFSKCASEYAICMSLIQLYVFEHALLPMPWLFVGIKMPSMYLGVVF